MGAQSVLYRLSLRSKRKSKGKQLKLKAMQAMSTRGAHGWDFFETAEGDKLLVVPNYYGCGSARGPSPADAACRSTAVYGWLGGGSGLHSLSSSLLRRSPPSQI
jgi:hypothetical protein